jgi:signal peptidase I
MKPALRPGDVFEVNEHFGSLRRGEIVIFRTPPHVASSSPYDIKRIVGLPGEVIASDTSGKVTVDRQQIAETYLPTLSPTTQFAAVSVPAARYFVLGDNRDQSRDSRFYGPIDKALIIGVVTRIVAPADRSASLTPAH